jgi:hypothetical protein
MMLAGCDDWRGVVLSLASRLVSMRQLRAVEAARTPLPPPPVHPWAEDRVELRIHSRRESERRQLNIDSRREEEQARGAGVKTGVNARQRMARQAGVNTQEEQPRGAGVNTRRQKEQQPRGACAYDADAAAAFAAQTLHVFVPIAHRLGMWFFKIELEELCFATIQPEAFQNLSASLQTVRDGALACQGFFPLPGGRSWG